MRSLLVLPACVLVGAVGAQAQAAPSAQVLCRLADDRIGETSGIAAGIASP